MLKINEVLNVEGTLFRILTILPHSIIWINISLKNAFPSEVIKTEILKGLENLNIKRESDPYESHASYCQIWCMAFRPLSLLIARLPACHL